MREKPNIFFCGMDEKTLTTLERSSLLQLVAINRIKDFETYQSYHPLDRLFKFIYQAMQKNTSPFFIKLMLFFLWSFNFFGTKITKKYFNYLKIIFRKKLVIIDLDNELESIQFIKNHAIDLMVVNNWWLLPLNLIKAPLYGTMNIHPSKLPKYRGSIPTLWSLKNKDKETAVSFMLLNDKMDGGDILKQYIIPIEATDDAIILEDKCNDIIATYLANDIQSYLNNQLKSIKQDHTLSSKTEKYYEYQKIKWNHEPCRDIVNKIKLYPYAWPLDYCYSEINHRRIYFYNVNIDQLPNALRCQPGRATIRCGYLFIEAIDGIVRFRLFFDLSWKDSIFLLKYRKNIIIGL